MQLWTAGAKLSKAINASKRVCGDVDFIVDCVTLSTGQKTPSTVPLHLSPHGHLSLYLPAHALAPPLTSLLYAIATVSACNATFAVLVSIGSFKPAWVGITKTRSPCSFSQTSMPAKRYVGWPVNDL
ncbi:MAG: hypothetical protein J3Q66DRAFT_393122 [Benniella sp.]|nr:MAG: hypothetical protein J3Q66DRAFT_393122 [Benniella sp.]